MPEPALKDTLLDLEEEIEQETGVAVRIPIDKKDVEVFPWVPVCEIIEFLLKEGAIQHMGRRKMPCR